MVKVNEGNFKELVLKSDKLVVVDFYADWCGPCKVLGPILEGLEPDNKDVSFVKVNIEEAPSITQKFGIRSVPTMFFIKDGEIQESLLGALPAPKIQEKIDELK
jgi:thioredoxin 1